MRRFALLALGAVILPVVTGCGDAKKDAAPPSGTTTASTAAQRTTTTEGPLIDDEPAADALLTDAQLPPGKWSAPAASATVWSISAQGVLDVPDCARVGLDGRARTEKRTGHAFDTWVEAARAVQLHEESELFPSPRRVDAFIAALKSAAMGNCIGAALREQSKDRGAALSEIQARTFDVGLRAADLRLSFLGGAEVSMTEKRDDVTTPVTLRFVCLGAGGGLVCLTETADDAQRLDTIDLAPTVRAAAKNLLATFGM
jgi:hypothetical protein